MGKLAVIAGITVLLAVVDMAFAVFAKEWGDRRHPLLLVGGVAASLALFTLFVVATRYAEMSTVTLGWIVMLQVGLMVTESVRYSVNQSADRWVAVAAMIAIQAYLLATAAPAAA